jgi:hypothetical protein
MLIRLAPVCPKRLDCALFLRLRIRPFEADPAINIKQSLNATLIAIEPI